LALIIARIKGGLGNQLFCYAAARRLAWANGAELAIDHVTGFARDRQFRRRYMLDHFRIPARMATPSERMEPFERYRRRLAKWRARRRPFEERGYIDQMNLDFEARLLELKVEGTLHLDGLWQSELYFADIASLIREDLRIIPPGDDTNLAMAERIRGSHAVALHVRWFNAPGSGGHLNLPARYYRDAVALMEERADAPHYFMFSDHPEAASDLLELPEGRVTFVSHNRGDENAYADLWLMSQCRHFITANSTFSWWGAWLGEGDESVVVTPDLKQEKIQETNWGFEGLIPERWMKV